MFKLDPEWVQFCTPRQFEILKAWEDYGTQRAAADALGCHKKRFSEAYRSVQRKAELQGYSPDHDMVRMVPDTYVVKGVSTYYNKDGDPAGQWVKSSVKHDEILQALKEAVSTINENIEKAEPVAPPAQVEADLCNVYTFTDYHLGMYAWHKEAGADWDLQIAEDVILSSLESMIVRSPKAHTAIINIQGDFLHTDGKLPVTPAHKHVLDADSRFPKIRRAAIRIIRIMVEYALADHEQVHLIIAEGNHDEEGAGWLADAFSVHYENEPRITVNDSVLPFYVFEWGANMIGVHHGHKVKNEQLPLLFAAQFPEQWGRTKRREIHCGHRHHRDEKEYNGVTVIQHPTLAARDAYAARGGWIADRAAWSITYHKQWGPIGRVMVCPDMFMPGV